MKKLICIMSLLCTTLGLTGCFSDEVVGEDGIVYASEIIIYTNQTSSGRGDELEKMIEEANFPFEVLLVELSGQTLKNRLISEQNLPFADVVLGGSTSEHLELKDAGVIAPYEPSWKSEIAEDYWEEDNYFTTWAIEPLYLVYNTKYYTNDASLVTSSLQLAPTSWIDLATNFAGEYNVFKSSSTSGSIIYSSILTQYYDEDGTLCVSEEGWEMLGELINNGIIDAGLWQANLASSKAPISMSWAGAVLEVEESYEVELEVVVPEDGVPATISQIAMVNVDSEGRTNAAKAFIEWWGQTETQVEWSNISRQAPANVSALALVDEEVRRLLDVKIMDLDWRFIADYSSDWREYIELQIIG